VVAVSGGVDSMVLLDLLVKQVHSRQPTVDSSTKKPILDLRKAPPSPDQIWSTANCFSSLDVSTDTSLSDKTIGTNPDVPWKRRSLRKSSRNKSQETRDSVRLVVAHFDHGIRDDSKQDRLLVQKAAKRYGLPFTYDEAHLGPGTSEADARTARYKFLHGVRQAAKAEAIITAHHQDDVLETAIINLLRGTNRRGLSALKSRPGLHRPLLHVPKHELIAYAKANDITWREDTTNQDAAYLRNRIRQRIVPNFSQLDRIKFLAHIGILTSLNAQIDELLINQLHQQPSTYVLDRHWFIMLPHSVAREVLATWLRLRGVKNIDKKRLELLVNAAKTLQDGKRVDVDIGHYLLIETDKLALTQRER